MSSMSAPATTTYNATVFSRLWTNARFVDATVPSDLSRIKLKTPQAAQAMIPPKDREQECHFDCGTFMPRRQIDESCRMCRAGESGQAFKPRSASRLHQHQHGRAH